MWDNREGKRNPKAPDFKCKDRSCDGVVWPSREKVAAALAALPAQPAAPAAANRAAAAPSGDGMPNCPVCGGPMWDDRLSKRNPKAPDFKCRNKPKTMGGPGCEGVIWPPRNGAPSPYPAPGGARQPAGSRDMSAPTAFDGPPPMEPPPFDDAPPFDDDDLPF